MILCQWFVHCMFDAFNDVLTIWTFDDSGCIQIFFWCIGNSFQYIHEKKYFVKLDSKYSPKNVVPSCFSLKNCIRWVPTGRLNHLSFDVWWFHPHYTWCLMACNLFSGLTLLIYNFVWKTDFFHLYKWALIPLQVIINTLWLYSSNYFAIFLTHFGQVHKYWCPLTEVHQYSCTLTELHKYFCTLRTTILQTLSGLEKGIFQLSVKTPLWISCSHFWGPLVEARGPIH